MSDILDKLSSYNLFNYLLPGFVFSAIADALTSYKILQEDIIVGIFVYYFVGLIISRIGSLCVEPVLKKIGVVKFSSYVDYVEASKEDDLIEVLSEANNMYRTFCSLFFCLVILKIFQIISGAIPFLETNAEEILVVFFLVLFGFSYRKQTAYIKRRIDTANNRGG